MVKSIPLPGSGRPHLSLNPSEYDNLRKYYVRLGHFAAQVKTRVEKRLAKARGRGPIEEVIHEKVASNLVEAKIPQEKTKDQSVAVVVVAELKDDSLNEVRRANRALECYSVEPEGLEAISEAESESAAADTHAVETTSLSDNLSRVDQHQRLVGSERRLLNID